MIRPFRIPIILSLLSSAIWAASGIALKSDQSLYLDPSPLQLADDMKSSGQWEDVLLLTAFSEKYLSQDEPGRRAGLHKEAEENLESVEFLARRFAMGAISGEPVDTASLLGSLSLDVFVIGDIRDLLVQGLREVSTGDGDRVIMALSATGLLLTLAPEISWAPALLKGFYRGGKISRPLMGQIEAATESALKTGNLVPLKVIVDDFSSVVKGLGAGPSLAVMKQIRSTDELTLVARKANIAPAETYTISRLAGPESLKVIRSEGRLAKAVKLGARQQKLFGKLFLALPMWLLIGLFSLSLGLAMYLLSTGYLLHRER